MIFKFPRFFKKMNVYICRNEELIGFLYVFPSQLNTIESSKEYIYSKDES